MNGYSARDDSLPGRRRRLSRMKVILRFSLFLLTPTVSSSFTSLLSLSPVFFFVFFFEPPSSESSRGFVTPGPGGHLRLTLITEKWDSTSVSTFTISTIVPHSARLRLAFLTWTRCDAQKELGKNRFVFGLSERKTRGVPA